MNLVEILKNVPAGTKFWSDIYGEVTFDGVVEDDHRYPIKTLSSKYTKDGKFYFDKGQCILFPSKTQRDWTKFKFDLPEGTKVMCSDNGCNWELRIYKSKKMCSIPGVANTYEWKYIVPVSDFDFENIEININKSI